MPIDPSIALSGKPVQIDTTGMLNLIAQGQQRRMAQETHAAQMQEHQQRIAAGERTARTADLKAKDDEISRSEFVKAGGDLDKWEQGLLQNGASADAVMAAQTHKQALMKQRVETAKNQNEVNTARDKRMQGLIQDTLQLAKTNPQLYQQKFGEIFDAAKAIDPETASHLDRNAPPSADDLGLFGLHYASQDWADKKIAEQRAAAKETREVAGEQRASTMAGPQLEKATAEAQMATDTAAGRKPIQPEEQARLDLQKRSNEEILRHNAATEKNATALLRVHQSGDTRAQQIYDQTYGEGANPALVGVEPKLRVQASSAAQKAANEFVTASEAATNMKTMIDLAKSGNKVAYAYAPTTGVLTINTAAGVKRVNMAEIKSYGGAGSALDHVEGWFGKQTSGASIPADILKNMEELHGAIAANAGSAYNTKLGAINQNYRSNFQPVKGAEAPKAGGGTIYARDPGGKLHEAPAGSALPAGWKEEKKP